MADALDLIARLANRGVTLTVVPGPPERLGCHAPKGVLTPALLDELREHRDAILAALKPQRVHVERSTKPRPVPCYACGGIRFWSIGNGHWVCGMCHPPAPGALRAGVTWREGRPSRDGR